jgi:23S rRNA (guanosine2251-2'-O)-methyltransferase
VTQRGGGQSRPGPGGRTKSGKPRPGTGGHGKRRLEGKGPTPPAYLRPGHPAQRRASSAGLSSTFRNGDGVSPGGGEAGRSGAKSRGAGTAAEVVAGRNAVLESLRAGVPASALHVGPRLDTGRGGLGGSSSRAGTDERISEAVMLAADAGVPVVEAGRAELDRLTGGAVHQGLALRVRPYEYAHPGDLVARAAAAGEPALIVALDGVTDPRNLGAVARSVAAFGGHGVLVPVRRSAGVTAGSWKASAGALARVPVAQASNLAAALAGYQEAGLFAVGLATGGAETVSGLELADGPLVLVVGSEGRGLSRLVAQRCDVLARIPMPGAAESLNAGVAAGIALYEVARRRAVLGRSSPQVDCPARLTR